MSTQIPASKVTASPKPRSSKPFAKFMNKYGTPLTTIFFLISTITGVALFFHWGPSSFHPMHEWLSMVLLLAFVLHLIKNWTPLVNYGRRGLLYIPLLIGIVASAYFFIQPAGSKVGGRQVAMRLIGVVSKAPLGQLAPLCGTDEQGLLARLRAQKLTVESATETVEQISKENNRTPNEVIMALMSGENARSEHGHGKH